MNARKREKGNGKMGKGGLVERFKANRVSE